MFGKLLRGGETQPLPELSLIFRLPSERQLRIQQEYDPLVAWSFLSHHIRRYPLDLRAHTQRVLLAQQAELSDRLAGSLQDVFLALGNAGHLLRERLLELVKSSLNTEDQAFFSTWLHDGKLQDGREQQWRKGSLLCSGQDIKPQRLVDIERSQVTASYTNVMDEVFACLEYGQVDVAQQLLEAELLAGTADEAMEQELLNIYQYTRNKDGLDAMIRHYEEVGRAFPTSWREKQQESVQWSK